ncbi:Organelle RRM domain-containing protein 1, chloroplastic [Glycine soja]
MGLSFYTTQEQLKKLFSPFGLVTQADLALDPITKRPKGFGFVSFKSEIEAEKACKAMNGRIVNGRLILVEPANEK